MSVIESELESWLKIVAASKSQGGSRRSRSCTLDRDIYLPLWGFRHPTLEYPGSDKQSPCGMRCVTWPEMEVMRLRTPGGGRLSHVSVPTVIQRVEL